MQELTVEEDLGFMTVANHGATAETILEHLEEDTERHNRGRRDFDFE